MAGPFYFAWTGGILSPAFSMVTAGDIYGGSVETFGDVWGGTYATQANITQGSNVLENILDPEGLIYGQVYLVTGPGIQTDTSEQDYGAPIVTFTWTGGTSAVMTEPAVTTHPGAMIIIRNADQVTTVSNVGSDASLVIGQAYGISGAGIQAGTTTVYDTSGSLTLSQPATTTHPLTNLTLTSNIGTNVINNLASVAGLNIGETYHIWGAGIPNNTFFTYEGGFSVTLTQAATLTQLQGFLSISKGITEDDGGAFDPATMLVNDLDAFDAEGEQTGGIFDIDITHLEGECASLKLTVRNPEIGLLGNGGQLWCWLAWDGDFVPGMPPYPENVIALFHGRVVGVPQKLADEVIVLEFVARPTDFFVQKSALAASLEVLPYWDPIWLQRGLADPDTALEAYSALWHIDRTSLIVTVSDIIDGEDGTLTIDETEGFYDELDASYSHSPLTSVSVSATVTWTQAGTGDVDLTYSLVTAFENAGSPYGYPLVGSYTADGLLSSWPKPLASFGGGWTMSPDSLSEAASWAPQTFFNVKYSSSGNNFSTSTLSPTMQVQLLGNGGTLPGLPSAYPGATGPGSIKLAPLGLSYEENTQNYGLNAFVGYQNYDVSFTMDAIFASFVVTYNASRKRSETLVFVLDADVQLVLTDPMGADTEVIEMSSAFIDQPVDPGGALPIGDVRRNSYFPTDRGGQSLQYLMLLARAKLLMRARGINIKFQTAWGVFVNLTGPALSCRLNIELVDHRLPGGQAVGKIVAYRLHASGDGNTMTADITIGCTLGMGTTISPAPVPADTYADDYSTGYDAIAVGSAIDLIVGQLQYQSLDGTYVLDDDGVDLFNMIPEHRRRSDHDHQRPHRPDRRDPRRRPGHPGILRVER